MEILQNISLAILGGMWKILVWTWWIIVPIIWYFGRKNFKRATYVANTNHVVLSVKIPKNNEKGPVAAEMMFAALHGMLQPKDKRNKGEVVQEHLSFEIVSTTNVIEFFVWTPDHLQDFVEGQIYAQYPTAEISKVEDYSKSIDIDGDNKDDCIAGTELTLVKEEHYPIKTFQNFDVDPLAGITGMLSKIEGEHEKVWIQILAKPIDDDWRDLSLAHIEAKKTGQGAFIWQHYLVDILHSLVNNIPKLIYALITSEEQRKKDKEKEEKAKKKAEEAEKKGPQLTHAQETELTAVEEKANKLGYKVIIRLVYLAKTHELAEERVKAAFGAFKQFNTTNLNGFQYNNVFSGPEFLNSYRARLFDEGGFILNIEELASLYHLPHVSVETPNIVWTSSKKGEPPANLPFTDESAESNEIMPLAQTTFRSIYKTFGIKRDDRRRHMYVVGKSGTGKSKLLETLAISDIRRGEGVAFIDPHGDSAETLLKFIPKERIDDVIYFNPADRDFPIAFNPLESSPEQREEVANGFVSVLKKLFGYSWGPRLEYVLKHTVSGLIEAEGSTMLGITRMLTDKNFRKRIVGQIEDPVVQMFWLKEFSGYNDKMATETISPILNKVGQFTASPIIRHIVGQQISTIDFAKAMNEGKIMIFNLSTGLIGEENAKLLGSMIVTKLQLAAMSRAALPEEERKDFYLYVDEFQNFATDSFAVILSEARKYRLSLIVANQYISQMEETVRDAVFGNVGTLISFRVGATDAAALEKEFSPVFEQNDLINLDNRHIYITMLIDGVSCTPFSAITLTRPEVENDLSSAVVAISRKKYGTPVAEVDEAIRHWYNVDAVIAGVNANEGDNPIINKRKLEKASAQVESPEGERQSEQGGEEINENNNIIAERPLVQEVEVENENIIINLSGNNEDSENKKKRRRRKKKKRNGESQDLKEIIKEVIVPEVKKEIQLERPLEAVAEQEPDKMTSTETKEPAKASNEPTKEPEKVFENHKEVKEITPEDFHNLKVVHPHQTIKVSPSKVTKEIKLGETVNFN